MLYRLDLISEAVCIIPLAGEWIYSWAGSRPGCRGLVPGRSHHLPPTLITCLFKSPSRLSALEGRHWAFCFFVFSSGSCLPWVLSKYLLVDFCILVHAATSLEETYFWRLCFKADLFGRQNLMSLHCALV